MKFGSQNIDAVKFGSQTVSAVYYGTQLVWQDAPPVPGAPTGLSAVPVYEGVNLSWAAPEDTGGTPITDYAVQYSNDGGATWVDNTYEGREPSTETTAFVEIYSGDTAYAFRVAAVNANGTGTYSETAYATTFVADGTYIRTDFGNDCYTYEVFADGQGGERLAQISFYCNTPDQLPAPTVTLIGPDTIRVSWQQGNNATASYSVEGSIDDFEDAETGGQEFGLYADYGGLNPGTYKFRVYAANPAGESAWSEPSAPITIVGPPAAPTSLSGTAGNGQVSLTWTAPSSDGGAAISDYTVEYSTDSGSSWTVFSRAASTATTVTVTGLVNGTAYTFRVRAVNSVGEGPPTSASSSVTPAPPAPSLWKVEALSPVYHWST
jgi:titin